jgi:hypothetical protein
MKSTPATYTQSSPGGSNAVLVNSMGIILIWIRPFEFPVDIWKKFYINILQIKACIVFINNII